MILSVQEVVHLHRLLKLLIEGMSQSPLRKFSMAKTTKCCVQSTVSWLNIHETKTPKVAEDSHSLLVTNVEKGQEKQ